MDSLGGDGEVGAGADQDFFQAADEFDYANVTTRGSLRTSLRLVRADEWVRPYTKSAEIEDGIADELAGAVEGDVAAAIAFEELDAALGQESGEAITLAAFALRPRVITGLCSSRRRTSPIFSSLRRATSFCCRAGRCVVDGAELDQGDQSATLPRIGDTEDLQGSSAEHRRRSG